MKKNQGITLVALVVTIIVLIILAGVSMRLILGDHGVIGRAKEATKETDIAETREAIELGIMNRNIQNNGYSSKDIISIIQQITGNEVAEGARTTTTKKGNEIIIEDLWAGVTEATGTWTQEGVWVKNGGIVLEVGQPVTGYTGGDRRWRLVCFWCTEVVGYFSQLKPIKVILLYQAFQDIMTGRGKLITEVSRFNDRQYVCKYGLDAFILYRKSL